MGKAKIVLTPTIIDSTINDFNTSEGKIENALDTLIKEYPDNTDLEEVMIKVAAIDSLYSTQLFRCFKSDNGCEERNKYIEKMSEKIIAIEQIDKILLSKDRTPRMKVISCIANVNNSNFDRVWSFASKYCNWHNQEGYAIFDKYSRGTIYSIYKTKENGLNGVNVTYDTVLDYESFYDLCEKFIAEIKERYSKEYTFKEIDKFLWYYGKYRSKFAIS